MKDLTCYLINTKNVGHEKKVKGPGLSDTWRLEAISFSKVFIGTPLMVEARACQVYFLRSGRKESLPGHICRLV